MTTTNNIAIGITSLTIHLVTRKTSQWLVRTKRKTMNIKQNNEGQLHEKGFIMPTSECEKC